jgi:transketolase
MRTAFLSELTAQARRRPEIFLVVGDLGFSVVEPFAKEFPDRFLNAGVAEQNMTGVAAGLASEGYHVFTYSIANFPTLRCLEQIRNDVAYHRLPVTVVSVGAGFAYGNLGYSHHAVQDIGILRALPEMAVLSPADPGEALECARWLAENPGPSYLRLGKAGEPRLHETRGITQGPLKVLHGQSDCALVSTGSVLKEVLAAARELENDGIFVSVFSCPWLQPVTPAFFHPLARFRHLVVVEEHLAGGGLASLLREHVSKGPEIISLAPSPEILRQVGSQEFLRRQAGIDTGSVAEAVRRILSCSIS